MYVNKGNVNNLRQDGIGLMYKNKLNMINNNLCIWKYFLLTFPFNISESHIQNNEIIRICICFHTVGCEMHSSNRRIWFNRLQTHWFTCFRTKELYDAGITTNCILARYLKQTYLFIFKLYKLKKLMFIHKPLTIL